MSASPSAPAVPLSARVRSAVIWRSGSQMVAQLVQWAATFLVIRILAPADYGLFAMTQAVLVLLNMLNGWGLATALIRQPEVTERDIRQAFTLLLLFNALLAAGQWLAAPWIAAWYRTPVVADILRVQAGLYLLTPFVALPQAMLSRSLDYRGQAKANMLASLCSAATALGGAFAGWGVWTLVAAPFVLFLVRGAVLTRAAGTLVRPLLDFRGAGGLLRFGGVVAAGQLFWFTQSQADVLIAGRSLSPHTLGIYTTALFLAQIFVSKVVPPLNEVAFPAYARLHAADASAFPAAFCRAAGVVLAAAMPFYLGLAATAEPLVMVALGAKWAEAVPVVRVLALAMPFMTLLVLLAPACDARGRPGVGVLSGAVGSVILFGGFLVGVRWGAEGLAWSWLASYPLYLLFALWRALPVIGVRAGDLAATVLPPLTAATAMAAGVVILDTALPPLPDLARLALLAGVGAGAYAGWLLLFARPLCRALLGTALGRQPAWI